MATKIETLKKSNGDQVLPRTRAKAVSMENGTTVEAAIGDITKQLNDKAEVSHEHSDLNNEISNLNTLVGDTSVAAQIEDYMLSCRGGSKVSSWKGKTLNFMGDSITEGYASTVKYTDLIATALSATCNNYGIGGSTVADGENPMYSRVLQMEEDADLCLVFGGTNDFANYDRVLGEQFITSEGKRTLNLDTNTFYGGLNQLCTNLYSRFPYSTLILCTPINRQSFAGQETDMMANGNGLYLDEYVEAIKKVAAYFAVPCLDLYATVNLYPFDASNIAKYYSASDQLHPNAEGHKHIANVMLAFFDTLADKRGRTVDEPDEPTYAAELIHSFEGVNATSTAWVDSVDPSYQFNFTGSPTVENGVVNFSSNSYGVLNKALDTEDIDTTLAIKVKIDNTKTYTWAFGSPNWENGFIIGKYENFGVDSNQQTWPMGQRIVGDPLTVTNDDHKQHLKLTIPDSNYHVYVARYIRTKNITYWYCDGVLMGVYGQSVVIKWLSNIINLNNEGAQYRGNNSFEYIKIWNRALSEDEILALT